MKKQYLAFLLISGLMLSTAYANLGVQKGGCGPDSAEGGGDGSGNGGGSGGAGGGGAGGSGGGALKPMRLPGLGSGYGYGGGYGGGSSGSDSSGGSAPAKLKPIVRVTDAKELFVLIREPVPRLQVLPEVPPDIAVRRQW